MDYVYISSRLAPQQAVLQYMEFHELVAMLKFSQCLFTPAVHTGRAALLHTARALRRQHAAPRPRPKLAGVSTTARVAVQWWQPTHGRHWPAPSGQAPETPRVGIVSTVQTLAGALSLGRHDLYISEVAADGATAPASIAVFSLRDGGLPCAGEPELQVLADVRALVAGIVLPDDAPPRFLALVRAVVQEHLWIPVDTLARSSLADVAARRASMGHTHTGYPMSGDP